MKFYKLYTVIFSEGFNSETLGRSHAILNGPRKENTMSVTVLMPPLDIEFQKGVVYL